MPDQGYRYLNQKLKHKLDKFCRNEMRHYHIDDTKYDLVTAERENDQDEIFDCFMEYRGNDDYNEDPPVLQFNHMLVNKKGEIFESYPFEPS